MKKKIEYLLLLLQFNAVLCCCLILEFALLYLEANIVLVFLLLFPSKTEHNCINIIEKDTKSCLHNEITNKKLKDMNFKNMLKSKLNFFLTYLCIGRDMF